MHVVIIKCVFSSLSVVHLITLRRIKCFRTCEAMKQNTCRDPGLFRALRKNSPDLNQGPSDLQSDALPTELSRQLVPSVSKEQSQTREMKRTTAHFQGEFMKVTRQKRSSAGSGLTLSNIPRVKKESCINRTDALARRNHARMLAKHLPMLSTRTPLPRKIFLPSWSFGFTHRCNESNSNSYAYNRYNYLGGS